MIKSTTNSSLDVLMSSQPTNAWRRIPPPRFGRLQLTLPGLTQLLGFEKTEKDLAAAMDDGEGDAQLASNPDVLEAYRFTSVMGYQVVTHPGSKHAIRVG